ncbi:MAG TPA: hypothetical protein VMB03_23925 [Bryobacteraceae bacterium]|nr:hypothetical protein [Bryobacteraceae bacterium]
MKTLWPLALALAAGYAGAQTTAAHKEIHVEEFRIQKGMGDAGSEPMMAGMIGADGRMGLLNVAGKPFSATETRHTLQTLANGAKIETSDSDQIYRDDQGRTRVEQTIDGRTITVIMDPVARFVAILDPAAKTAHKNPIPPEMVKGSVGLNKGQVRILMKSEGLGASHAEVATLGDKAVNGVMASGTRKTRVIPAGAIGNDRDLQLVDESWFSNDLQAIVKSVSSDPRFGETTYQLTNIVRAAQDPALFQIPPDYAISDRPALGK